MNDSMRVSPGLPSIPVFIGAVLIVLGAIVILGWLLKIPELVRVVPGFAPMVFNTALCFMLLGAALATASQTWRQRVQPMLGGFTIAIAVLVLSQDLFSIDVGIDHLFSADWLHDPRPRPTRMAPNTAVAFILSGATLILFNLGRRPWVVNLARYLALAVMLIGLTAVLGYLLKLEFLFAWYPNARMAVHTASGFTLLGIGLWGYRRWTRTTSAVVDSPDERILLTGNVILIVLALVGSVSGFFIFGKETEAFLRRSLERSLYNRVEIYQDYLQHAIKEAKFIAHRPGVLRELSRLRADPGNAESLRFLREVLRNFGELGFNAATLYDSDGRKLATYGTFADASATRAAIALPYQAEIVWQDSLRLRLRLPVASRDRRLGTLVSEQRLELLEHMFSSLRSLGETGEMVVCARNNDEMTCFPSRLQPKPYVIARFIDGQPLPMSRALDGVSGMVESFDYRRQHVVAAYRPIAETGLGMVIKIDREELYQPLFQQLRTIMLVMIVLAVSGALLLRLQVLPVARRLVRAEHDARERGESSRALLEAAPDAVVVADADGRITRVNDQVGTLFGYARTELIGEPVEILQPERLRAQHAQHRHSYSRKPERRAMGAGLNLLGRHKDGSEFPIEVSLSPLQTDAGLIVISAIRDISERQHLQQALAESEQRYRQLADQSRGLICMHDPAGKLLYVNAAAAEQLGHTPQEMIDRNLLEFLAPGSKSQFPAYLEHIARERHVSGLMSLQTKDGHKRVWTYDNAYYEDPVRGAYVLGHAQDITEMRYAQRALQASEIRLRAIMENATDCIVTVNEQGLIESFNTAACVTFGYHREQVIGQSVQMLMPEALRGAHAAGLRRYLEGGTRHVVGKGLVELQGRRDDGSVFPLELGLNEVWVDGKRLFIGILRDITARKQTEQTIRELSLEDELTGLRNRRGFMTLANAEFLLARRMKRGLALFYADLDGMKTINDTHGHAQGDNALRDVADILRKTFRDSDIIARLGGDEFAVLALETRQQKPEQIIQRLNERISEHNRSQGRPYALSLSIGAVHVDPEAGMTMESMLARADAEMYRVKQARGKLRRG